MLHNTLKQALSSVQNDLSDFRISEDFIDDFAVKPDQVSLEKFAFHAFSSKVAGSIEANFSATTNDGINLLLDKNLAGLSESLNAATVASEALKTRTTLTSTALYPQTKSSAANPISVNSFGGITAAVSINVNATSDNNVNALLWGTKWASTNITFSFTDSAAFRLNVLNSDFTDYEGNYDVDQPGRDMAEFSGTFKALNATQKAVTRDWLQKQYFNVSFITPIELTGASDRDATMRIGTTENATGTGTAFGNFPANNVEAGDAWFSNGPTQDQFGSPIIGNFQYTTFGHEYGHALGLKHGHQSLPNNSVVMNADRDSSEFSIMTYRCYVGEIGLAHTNEEFGNPHTLMMYDIRAIQHLYGAYFGHEEGDTSYTFSTTTGEMFINGVGQGKPGANRIFRTVWDGNGVDTYNFSNYSTNLAIDLTPGGWSNLDRNGNFQKANLDKNSTLHYARGHVFNALQYNGDTRSLIENSIGGTGNDSIKGNTANNKLEGGAGNDSLDGGTGNDLLEGNAGADRIDGGAGIDYVSYYHASSTFIVNLLNPLLNTGDALRDTFIGIENIEGSFTASSNLTGNTSNNTLYSYSGNDTLNGGGGNDVLVAGGGNDSLNGGIGNDSLYGELGNDTYVIEGANDLIFEDLNQGIDVVQSSASYVLGANIENLTLLGTATNGTGNILNNTINGNAITNVLTGGSGNDSLNGNEGNDYLYGGINNDSLSGGIGNDILRGGAGADKLDGGTGNDYSSYYDAISPTLVVNLLNPLLNTGDALGDTFVSIEWLQGSLSASNNLTGNASNNNLYGYNGNDTLSGDAGNDLLSAGAGNDTLQGGTGNDSLYGGINNDSLSGGIGNDILRGGAGADKLDGGTGNDYSSYYDAISPTLVVNLLTPTLNTGDALGDTFVGIEWLQGSLSASNNLTGNASNNNLYSYNGNDTLSGGAGNDLLSAGAGNDSLQGGAGNDSLSGGVGSDRFQFSGGSIATTITALTGIDSISDFLVGVDQIVLSKITFSAISSAIGASIGTNFDSVANDTDVGASGSSIVYSQFTGKLFYNFDLTPSGLGLLGGHFATLTANLALTDSNFSVIA